jgi:ABC-type Fe3+ transport system substrate-binding protein
LETCHYFNLNCTRTRAIYSAAMVTDAPHADTARAWLDFIRSDAAFAALAPFGFQRVAR